MKRLFFALWPDARILQRCADLMDLLPESGHQRVVLNNLHVTLVFLGHLDETTEHALLKAADKIKRRETQLIFDQLSFWKKPEVLCLTGRSLDAELPLLVEDLTDLAKQLAITVDTRPYQAHITLARKAKEAVLVEFEPFIWLAKGFCLAESCSLPTGVEYRVSRIWE